MIPRSPEVTATRGEPLGRLRTESFAEMAYTSIRDSILTGRLAPGERLVEVRLAESLGVSKAPIREALKRLREERLVVEQPRYGTFVRELTEDDFVHIYHMRLAIEGLAVQLVLHGDTDLDPLADALRALEAAAGAGDAAALAAADVHFHETLCALTGNEYLTATFTTLSGPIRIALAADNRGYGDPEEIVAEHVALLDAVRSGDVDGAVATIQDHILHAARQRGIAPDRLVVRSR